MSNEERDQGQEWILGAFIALSILAVVLSLIWLAYYFRRLRANKRQSAHQVVADEVEMTDVEEEASSSIQGP